MGAIVDKTHTKWGKCRPYLLFAPLVICIITCLAFLNGDYAAAKAHGSSTKMFLITAWAAISYILWGMSYTVGDIPLWGIISRMSEDENDRAKLISLSRIIASIGAAVVVVSIIALSQAANKAFGEDDNAQKGFIIVGMVITVIASLLLNVPVWVRESESPIPTSIKQ